VNGTTRKEAHSMALKRRIVLIDWVDGDISDSDEVVVVCQDDATAISRAKAKWRMTIGAQWPRCRITKAEILTQARLQGFA
jgi:hypothetical protein